LKPIFFLIILLLASCNSFFKKRTEPAIARVGDDYLYQSDLRGIIPPGSLPKDSLTITRSYVENWVRQKLIIEQAINNLNNEQMDFNKQLEEYKNSLIIYAYENALIKQKLDTVVTVGEMQDYYDFNQQNFLLKENIVQLQYVKLPLASNMAKQIKKLLYSGDDDEMEKLTEICENNAFDYFFDNGQWLYFNDVANQLPIRTYNPEDFLKNHRDVEVQDSLFRYLVRFNDFKIKDALSPFSLEQDRIRDIILNKRKIGLIQQMREDIYSKALKNNGFEIFY